MTPVFSDEGMRRLDAIVRPAMLCAFDFDGTLAPIVALPSQVALPAELAQRLRELSTWATTAIITGRALGDIRARLDFEPDYVVGNHGIEGLPGNEHQDQQFEQLCAQWHAHLTEALRQAPYVGSGIWLENKIYTLTLHFRQSRDPARAEAALADLLRSLDPAPRVIAGKFVFNLMPEDAGHKGNALEHLIDTSGASSALYVGDDVNDEDAFRLQRCDLLSIRIGKCPDTAANLFLNDQRDMERLLDEILRRLRRFREPDQKRLESAHHGSA